MHYFTARRINDGVLHWAYSSPAPPTPETVVQNAESAYGGEWEFMELTESQYIALTAIRPAKGTFNGGQLTLNLPPSIETDKDQIQDDGIDKATITVDFNDPLYNGDVKWTIIVSSVKTDIVDATATAGIAILELTTTYATVHLVQAMSVQHGVASIEIEGI